MPRSTKLEGFMNNVIQRNLNVVLLVFLSVSLLVMPGPSRSWGEDSKKLNLKNLDVHQLPVYPINWQDIENSWVWIFGGHLMTENEKSDYIEKYQELDTRSERAAYKNVHRKKMMVRMRRLDPDTWERYYGPIKPRKEKRGKKNKIRIAYPLGNSAYEQEEIALEDWKRYFNKLRHIKNDSQFIFGAHLMTEEEKRRYFQNYYVLETVEQRFDFRDLHRSMILERAKILDPRMWERYESMRAANQEKMFFEDDFFGRFSL
ncbi:hypothetical protein BVX98_02900 [bacterium F11]|nr:hypothetical protein BVX98_02900 [bacterium F11]